MIEPIFLQVDDRRIAVRYRPPADATRSTLVFLPGYASDMIGAKALAVDGLAEASGSGCLRFDYSGTGESGGDFADGTLARWLDEALGAIDRLTTGRLVVVGSSMGGWLALHITLRRPARIAALIGIAAAPDFTEWAFDQHDRTVIATTGRLERTSEDSSFPSVTHAGFWHAGQSMLLLDDPIDVRCPVRLIHGDGDDVVPPGIAHRIVERLRSADVQLLLIKGGGHRLSEPHEIDALLRLIAPLLETAR